MSKLGWVAIGLFALALLFYASYETRIILASGGAILFFYDIYLTEEKLNKPLFVSEVKE